MAGLSAIEEKMSDEPDPDPPKREEEEEEAESLSLMGELRWTLQPSSWPSSSLSFTLSLLKEDAVLPFTVTSPSLADTF